MLVVYNNEQTDNILMEFKLVKNDKQNYVSIVFDSGDYLTVIGDDSSLERLAEVLQYEDISVNLDDFIALDYYENIPITDIVASSSI